jgi:hypothetical protein
MVTQFQRVVEALAAERVQYVVVGGVALVLHGSPHLLGEPTGVGGFDAIAPTAESVNLYGHDVRVISLEALASAKRAAGRLKDLADLEIILELQRQGR